MADWFKQGYDGVEEAVKAKEAARNRVQRVWLKPHTSKNLVFLDDAAFSFYEHQVKINGRWDNFFTCIGKANGCPLCLSGMNPYLNTVFTVIDRTEYQDKKGIKHADEKRLFAVKEETALTLKEKHKRWGGMKNKEIVATRKGDKDASCGSDFELVLENGQIKIPDLSHLKDKNPYNYMELFKPQTAQELREVLNIAQTTADSGQEVSKSSSGGGEQPSEDIPF